MPMPGVKGFIKASMKVGNKVVKQMAQDETMDQTKKFLGSHATTRPGLSMIDIAAEGTRMMLHAAHNHLMNDKVLEKALKVENPSDGVKNFVFDKGVAVGLLIKQE